MNLISDIRIIRSLIRLNKNVLLNSLKRSDAWLRVFGVLLIFYVLYNSAASSSVIVSLFKSGIHRGDPHFFPFVNLVLFLLFILNILSSLYIGSSKYSDRVGSKLVYYPVSSAKQVLFGTVACMTDFYNLIFFPVYIISAFMIAEVSSPGKIISELIILPAFFFLIGGLIFFLKNLYAVFVTGKKQKRIFLYAAAAIIILIALLSGDPKQIFSNFQNIKLLSGIIVYTPSGILAKFITSNSAGFQGNFIKAFSYFILLNAALFLFNISIQKRLKGKVKNAGFGSRAKNEGRLTALTKKYAINPVSRKDVLYSIRSSRELINNGVVVFYYLLTILYVLQNRYSSSAKHFGVIPFEVVFIFFQVIIELKFCANFFGYDYTGIINYFAKPLKSSEIIEYKLSSFKYFSLFNSLIATIVLYLLGIKVTEYLLFTSLTIVVYIISKPIGALLSIYFPLSISFSSLTGMNMTFRTLLIVMIFSFVLSGLSYLILSISSDLYKSGMTILLFASAYFINKSNKRINNFVGRIMKDRKERILYSCGQT